MTTTNVSGITQTNATAGGNLTGEGGAEVTSRGVCWNTSESPTVANSKTSDGIGTGSFISSLTQLIPNTKYYVKAYATNSAGTGYGSETSLTISLIVGSAYQGGVIAYILQPGDPGYIAGEFHGLIAAPNDQASKLPWQPIVYITDPPDPWCPTCPPFTHVAPFVSPGTTGSALGTGAENTNRIVAVCTSGSDFAAGICSNLTVNGYSDWYLPSRDELHKLSLNKTAIGNLDVNYYYWSSTYDSYESPWTELIFLGFQGQDNWSVERHVRAIRSF